MEVATLVRESASSVPANEATHVARHRATAGIHQLCNNSVQRSQQPTAVRQGKKTAVKSFCSCGGCEQRAVCRWAIR
eukprot:COSAG06_NODE_336_length_17272_cov_50.456647_13_plen_77_part_00